MKTSDFDFEVPAALIADHPVEPRDRARMLHVAPDGLSDLGMRDLPSLLAPGDVLVLNDTRVIPARLAGRRGEARVEITLHKDEGHKDEGRKEQGAALWRAFARPAKRLKAGDRIVFAEDFSAEVAEKGEGGEIIVRFDRAGPALVAALHRHGIMPLPPYIRRAQGGDARDQADYQTVFAARDGAVAAPTAGLHFTTGLLERIAAAGVASVRVTLHVGAGTFLPVKVDDIAQHRMHSEYGEVSAEAAEAINRARARGGRVVTVGTTALRVLESAAGADGLVRPFAGDTDLFITPGYRFRAVDRLITNFHLPRSTLFMLVSAFCGLTRMRAAYAHAVAAGYRFYSYGDCCFLEPGSLDSSQ